MTKRRRTPVGTEPPPVRQDGSWLDGSWLVGVASDAAPAHDEARFDLSTVDEPRDEAWVDELRAVSARVLGAELARGSKPPRAITSEPTGEASGTIVIDARVAAHERALERQVDDETSVVVHIDDEWLARLDLSGD